MASPRPTPEAIRLSAAVDAAGQRLAVTGIENVDAAEAITEDDVIALTRRVQTLETEVDSLRQALARLCEQLGVET